MLPPNAIVQRYRCSDTSRLARIPMRQFKTFPLCCDCATKSDMCRFVDCRYITPEQPNKAHLHCGEDVKEPVYPQFHQTHDKKVNADGKRACARVLKPLLERELEHRKRPGIIHRQRELSTRVICDRCATELFSQCWICSGCGWEGCHACVSEVSLTQVGCPSCKADLLPVTRFNDCEVERALSRMNYVLPKASEAGQQAPPSQQPSPTDRTVPVLDKSDKTTASQLLSQGVPFVVNNVQLRGTYDPKYFINKYYGNPCRIHLVESGTTKETTVDEFFRTFGHLRAPEARAKLKDWPSEKHFRTEFTELYDAFMAAVPFPDTMTLNGARNLAAHFPTNGIAPDGGPKLYCGHILTDTLLHMDMADAINIAIYMEGRVDDVDGEYAKWLLWSRCDRERLRDFLREHFTLDTDVDPINSGDLRITEDMLVELTKRGIQPYIIHQRVNQAVIIPALTPHYVMNKTNAVKIACDFVSMENLDATAQVNEELRRHRLSGTGEDVLQLLLTLWHAWTHLDMLSASSTTAPAPGPFTCPICKDPFVFRNGLVHHIRDRHPEKVRLGDLLSAASGERFGRKRGLMQFSDAEFMAKIRSFVLPERPNV